MDIELVRFFPLRLSPLLGIGFVILILYMGIACQSENHQTQPLFHIFILSNIKGKVDYQKVESQKTENQSTVSPSKDYPESMYKGGFSLISGKIKELCNQYGFENSLVVFNSNFLYCTAESYFTEGAAIIELMSHTASYHPSSSEKEKNLPSAFVLGHRDFYFGQDVLGSIRKNTTIPLIFSNIILKSTETSDSKETINADKAFPFSPYYIHPNGKIGLIGIGSSQVKRKTSPKYLGNWEITDGAECVATYIQELKEKNVEHIFIVSDMNVPISKGPLSKNKLNELDSYIHPESDGLLLVDSELNPSSEKHSFIEITTEQVQNPVYLVGPGGYTLGHLLYYENQKQPEYHVYPINNKTCQPDKTLADDIHALMRYMDQIKKETIAIAAEDFFHYEGETTRDQVIQTTMGSLLADICKSYIPADPDTHDFSQPDVVLINTGFISKAFKKGSIHKPTLFNAIPMPDYLINVPVRGTFIHKVLEQSVHYIDPKSDNWKDFLQVAGVTFKYDPTQPVGHRILPEDILINEEPIDLEEKYGLGIPEFIYNGNAGYHQFINPEFGHLIEKKHAYFYTESILEMVTQFLKKKYLDNQKMYPDHQTRIETTRHPQTQEY